MHEELTRIVAQLESKELVRYATLRERSAPLSLNSLFPNLVSLSLISRLVWVVSEMLTECRKPCRDMIRDLVQIELAFVNTAHPDFAGSVGAINNIVEKATEERVRFTETGGDSVKWD